MICEFLDYYSSRFDLNRCFSSSSIRRPSIEQQQHRKQHKLCARDFDAPKYFIIFLKSTFRLFASQLMLFFLFSFTLILRLLNAKVSRFACENKTHSRNYIVRQQRNVTANFESNCKTEYGSTTQQKWIFIWAMESQQQSHFEHRFARLQIWWKSILHFCFYSIFFLSLRRFGSINALLPKWK